MFVTQYRWRWHALMRTCSFPQTLIGERWWFGQMFPKFNHDWAVKRG